MRIQHNINALNAHRQLGTNNTAVGKNLEKLSSGFRINRAGDDAAGLAISEKMRGQIRGLDMATRNANDGISLIQTAEGALNETHSILQRMRELAVQSSNDTYEEGVDRIQLNKEVDALKKEIDRIANSTHFNNQKLLNGDLSAGGGSSKISYEAGSKIKAGADVAAVAQAGVTGATGLATAADNTGKTGQLTIEYRDADGSVNSLTVEYAGGADKDASQTNALKALQESKLGTDYDITNTDGAFTFTAKEAGASRFEVLSTTYKADKNAAGNGTVVKGATNSATGVDAAYQIDLSAAATPTATTNNKFEIDGQKFQLVLLGDKADDGYTAISVSSYTPSADTEKQILSQLKDHGIEAGNGAGGNNDNIITVKKTDGSKQGGGVTFQIGANGDADDRVSLSVNKMDSAALGVAGVDISTREGANKAIDMITKATNSVSSTRADLGALQNRLEHTVANLGVTVENLTAAESRIRDVDMAKEMMEMTKNNILTQAAQAMLAQANTQPQSVLQLLQ